MRSALPFMEFLHEQVPAWQNLHVLQHLRMALELLEQRTYEREARNVEGTYKV